MISAIHIEIKDTANVKSTQRSKELRTVQRVSRSVNYMADYVLLRVALPQFDSAFLQSHKKRLISK